MKTKTELATTEEELKQGTTGGEVMHAQNTAPTDDDSFFGSDIDTGMGDVTSADVALPRFTILQGLSPQVNSRKDEYVEGAKMGMIFNTATGKVIYRPSCADHR